MTRNWLMTNKGKRMYAGYKGASGEGSGYHETFIIGEKGHKRFIEVYPPHYDESDGYYDKEWTVVYDGAVDYTGNKSGLLRRYPELSDKMSKKHLRVMTKSQSNKVRIGMRMFKI